MFIDVGANIGAVAIPIAKARPNVSIVCIEADPKIQRLLQDNVNRNGCKRVQVISCVAGATDGQFVAFYPAPDDRFGMGSLGPQFCNAPIMLEQRPLDTILTDMNIYQPDVIKIDVEGAELGVLQGARRLLASERPPVIVFEFTDWAEARIPGQQPGDALAFLIGNGKETAGQDKGFSHQLAMALPCSLRFLRTSTSGHERLRLNSPIFT
jgi:FkbM family methyltransferase